MDICTGSLAESLNSSDAPRISFNRVGGPKTHLMIIDDDDHGGSDDDPDYQEEEEDNLPVDYESVFAGAVFGVPTHERSFMARECVAGVSRPNTETKGYMGLLKNMARVDQKLLRDRLSHLAEGEYDVATDVVRPRRSCVQAQLSVSEVTAMAVEEDSVSFRRRAGAEKAKAHMRRRTTCDDDD
eukprot:TRINITY_DN55205_c0_g1_i1.p1 TRINITY_DN55205_c0_g1~~TRINITY_DN55205_c0_g1_i1.p1  ORF type:complete len:215 (-),score=37.38 TRINITY_DN55205_c0_g1_i1:218-769(-)